MSQEVKQRVNAAKTSVEPPKTKAKNLLSFQPDYAIKVLYKHDTKDKQPDLESEANLKILVSILTLNGFHVEIRPDTNTNYSILFVTLNDTSFEQLVSLANEIDSVYDVKPNVLSDDKISVAERLRLIDIKLKLPTSKGGCGFEAGKSNIKSILPVRHILNLEKEFKTNSKNFGKVLKKSVREKNVSFLKENLGTKYAVYYKFVQAYISSIGCIAIFGVLAWYFLGNFSLIYAIINLTIGSTCYLCVYANEKKLKKDWQLNNISKTATLKLDEGDLIPTWKILLRQFYFIPVIVGGASSLFLTQFACFLLEIFINEIYQGPFQSILALIPTALVCTLVPAGTIIYGIIAKKYLGFEKNPTEESENQSLLVKMFAFNCLASYSPLLITAFIYLPIGYCLDPYLETIKSIFSNATSVYTYVPKIPTLESEYKVNNLRMSSQIFYFMVINQVVGTLVEFVLPVVLSKVLNISKIAKLLGTPASTKSVDFEKVDEPEEHEYLELVRAEFLKPAFCLDDDYRQHVLQYGFLMLFGPVWTLGALSCFIFGVIQQEGDYVKYIKLAKPPVGARTESSAPWILFMRLLLIIGSFVSMAITLMYNNKSGTEEISSYVGKSSVSNSWVCVIGGALLSCITVQVFISCLENVINSVYDTEQTKGFSEEIKVSNLISDFSKRDEQKTNMDQVDHILEEAKELLSTY